MCAARSITCEKPWPVPDPQAGAPAGAEANAAAGFFSTWVRQVCRPRCEAAPDLGGDRMRVGRPADRRHRTGRGQGAGTDPAVAACRAGAESRAPAPVTPHVAGVGKFDLHKGSPIWGATVKPGSPSGASRPASTTPARAMRSKARCGGGGGLASEPPCQPAQGRQRRGSHGVGRDSGGGGPAPTRRGPR